MANAIEPAAQTRPGRPLLLLALARWLSLWELQSVFVSFHLRGPLRAKSMSVQWPQKLVLGQNGQDELRQPLVAF